MKDAVSKGTTSGCVGNSFVLSLCTLHLAARWRTALEITIMSGGSITVHRQELCSVLLGTPVFSGGEGQETETKVRSLPSGSKSGH